MKHALLAIAFVAVLFIALPSMPMRSTDPPLEETSSVGTPQTSPTMAAYQPHAPIIITTNDDFLAQGWPGSGIPKDPFVISGLNITTTAACINVSNTTAVFTIQNCLLSSPTLLSNEAVRFQNLIRGSVIGCVIDKHPYGIYLSNSSHCWLSNNTVTAYGDDARCFALFLSNHVTLYNNTAHPQGNPLYPQMHQFGFYLDHSPDCVLTGNAADGSMVLPENVGFFLRFSDSCNLSDNAAYGNGNFGFGVYGSKSCILSNNTSTSKIGFGLWASSECTAIDNTATSGQRGFDLDSSTDCILRNNTDSGSWYGFYVDRSMYCLLTDNRASGTSEHGFFLSNSYGIVFSGDNSTGNSKAGFYLEFATSCALAKCTATGNSITEEDGGFHLLDSYNCTLTDSTATDNSLFGIILDHSVACALVNTTVADNTYGFYLSLSVVCYLINNSVSTNANTGLFLGDSHECVITENAIVGSNYGIYVTGTSTQNTFFLNWMGPNNYNAHCDSVGNTWDDGMSQGNHWSDYNGTGVYPVSGPAGSVDRFPFGMKPSINHPADIQYDEGSTGHSITWNPSSNHPFSYELYIDTGTGIQYGTGPWHGSAFIVSIDGLSIGSYSYRLVVYDTAGNSTSDTVIATVVDSTPPTISTPPDIVYESGTTAHKIVWTPHDLHLGPYSIARNQTPVSGAWDGTTITVSVDGLALGIYNYTLVVNDTSGNSASDTVFITVVDNTAPTIDRPADLTYNHGTTGHMIAWIPHDLNPASYSILRDGGGVASAAWNGPSINVSVDGLAVGSYNYTIIVHDTSGNSVSDQVTVTVIQPSTTTTTTTHTDEGQPLSVQMVMLAAAEGIAIILLVVALYIRRK